MLILFICLKGEKLSKYELRICNGHERLAAFNRLVIDLL